MDVKRVCTYCDDSGVLVFKDGHKEKCPACKGTGMATEAAIRAAFKMRPPPIPVAK